MFMVQTYLCCFRLTIIVTTIILITTNSTTPPPIDAYNITSFLETFTSPVAAPLSSVGRVVVTWSVLVVVAVAGVAVAVVAVVVARVPEVADDSNTKRNRNDVV